MIPLTESKSNLRDGNFVVRAFLQSATDCAVHSSRPAPSRSTSTTLPVPQRLNTTKRASSLSAVPALNSGTATRTTVEPDIRVEPAVESESEDIVGGTMALMEEVPLDLEWDPSRLEEDSTGSLAQPVVYGLGEVSKGKACEERYNENKSPSSQSLNISPAINPNAPVKRKSLGENCTSQVSKIHVHS